MVEECAEAKSPVVRARMQELSAHVVDELDVLLRKDAATTAVRPTRFSCTWP